MLCTLNLARKNLIPHKAKTDRQGYSSTPVSNRFLWNYYDANKESQELWIKKDSTNCYTFVNVLNYKSKNITQTVVPFEMF